MKKMLNQKPVKTIVPLLFFALTVHPSYSNKINLASMDELKAEVIFSTQPFEGENSPGKTAAFKAWDEIYGRVVFTQPIKEALTGYFAGGVHDEGGTLIAFELKHTESGEVFSGVTKKLSAEDLEKNYFDFDIAPAINRSRDVYTISFSDGVAGRNSSFEDRTKGNFVMSVYFLNNAHDKIEEQYISGKFSLDYSNLPDGDKGITKLGEWSRQIYQAADDEQVKMNIKKNAQKPSIVFSTLPFSNAAHVVVSKVKAGDPIYGRITLAKPLKEYINEGTPKKIRIDIHCLNDNITGLSVEKTLRSSEFNNAFIDFDVFPTAENAKDVYDSNLGFYFTIFAVGMTANNSLHFEISLATDYNINYNGLKKMEAFGEIEIDYTGLTSANLTELNNKGRKVGETAEANADKLMAIESAQLVKSMPMPVVFTRASKTGYTGYSNATIVNMIKARYKVTEVLMLTFDEADGSGDFTSLTDLNNYPTEKIGNHVFYFVFKDPTDGQYKFAGGRLRMLYEGNGKYSEAYVYPYSPMMNDDPQFPYDYGRSKMGYDSVFFFDGAKIKK